MKKDITKRVEKYLFLIPLWKKSISANPGELHDEVIGDQLDNIWNNMSEKEREVTSSILGNGLRN